MTALFIALAIAVALVFLGVFIGRVGEEGRRSLRKKLYEAQDTLFNVEKNVLDYSGQLDIVGTQMSREILFKLNNWKKGMIK